MKYILKLFHIIIIFWAFEVICAWILSALSLYTTKSVLLITIFFFIVLFSYLILRRQSIYINLGAYKSRFMRLSRRNKILVLLVVGVWITFLLFNLIYITFSPAINWDSLTYHLTKVANGMQHGSLWYDPNITVSRVNIFGSNSSILNGVAFAIFGIDYLIELPQLLSAILIPLALVYIGVEIFKKSKVSSILSSLAVLTVPLYLYEANTTQNDLTFMLILLISVIMLHRLYLKFNLPNLLLLLFAVAILVGTKHHGTIAGGIIGALILIRLVQNLYKSPVLTTREWLVIILATPLLILIAIPNNIIGFIHYGSFIALDPGDAKKVTVGPLTIWNNIRHFGAWFYLRSIEEARYFSHDVGHAGFLNMFALPIYIFVGVKVLLRRHYSHALFFLVIWGTLAVLFSIRNPDEWDLRLILFLPVTAVFIGTLYLLNSSRKYIRYLSIVVLLSLVLFNLGLTFAKIQYPVLKLSVKSWFEKQVPMSIGDYYKPRYMENVGELDNHRNGVPSRILVSGNNDSPLYPYYGERWENNVEYINMIDILDGILDQKSWDYLVIYHYSDENVKSRYTELQAKYTKISKDAYVDIFLNKPIDK